MKLNINQKVDLLPLIITAFAILCLIKISSFILPAGYYFSVSSVFKTNTELMLVKDQGLPAAKLCELLKRNNIEPDDVDLQQQNCDQLINANKNFSWGANLTLDEKEEVYEEWVSKREKIEEAINSALNNFSLTNEVTENQGFEENNQQELYKETVNQVARNVSYDLTSNSIEGLAETITQNLINEFSAIENKFKAKETADPPENNAVEFQGIELSIDPIDLELIKKSAKQAAINALNEKQFSDFLTHPKRSEAINTIEGIYDPSSITNTIVALYMEEISNITTEVIRTHLSASGVPISSVKESVSNLKRQMVYENLPSYILSASIRVLTVFIAVAATAFILLGKYEVASFAFGGAFAALLLTWPVISLWDVAVNADWQSMRGKFLIIYAVYIVAFFFTAKLASLASLYIRDHLNKTSFISNDLGAEGVNVSAKELFGNLFITIALNSLAFGANLVVPNSG